MRSNQQGCEDKDVVGLPPGRIYTKPCQTDTKVHSTLARTGHKRTSLQAQISLSCCRAMLHMASNDVKVCDTVIPSCVLATDYAHGYAQHFCVR